MSNNQGIIHIADTRGGRAWCRNRKAHMSTTVDLLHTWGRVCARCQAQLDQRNVRAAAKTAPARSETNKIIDEQKNARDAAARTMLAALYAAQRYLRPACEDGRHEARKLNDLLHAAGAQAEAAGIKAEGE